MICATYFIICVAHIMKCVTEIIIVWLLLWNVCTHFISKNFHAHTTDCRQNITYISLICMEGKTQIIIVTQIIIRVFTQIIIVTQIIISRSGDFCSNTYHNNYTHYFFECIKKTFPLTRSSVISIALTSHHMDLFRALFILFFTLFLTYKIYFIVSLAS